MTKKRNADAVRRSAKKENFYQDAYAVLKSTIDFKQFKSFKNSPRKGKVIVGVTTKDEGHKPIKEPGYKFTPAQKAMLSKMAINKDRFNEAKQNAAEKGEPLPSSAKYRQHFRSEIYNKSAAVKAGNYTLVKLNKKQKEFFKSSEQNTVTNKGLILPNKALNAKAKKTNDGYTVTYSVPKKDGSESKRKEIYFPFPEQIKTDPNLLQAYMQRVFDLLKPSNFQMAVNTHHGLATHHPKLLNNYMQQLHEYNKQKGTGDVYAGLSGFYLVTHKAESADEMIAKIEGDEIIQSILDFSYENEFDEFDEFDPSED